MDRLPISDNRSEAPGAMSMVTMDTSLHHQVLSTLPQFLSKATSAFFSSTVTSPCQGRMVLPLNQPHQGPPHCTPFAHHLPQIQSPHGWRSVPFTRPTVSTPSAPLTRTGLLRAPWRKMKPVQVAHEPGRPPAPPTAPCQPGPACTAPALFQQLLTISFAPWESIP